MIRFVNVEALSIDRASFIGGDMCTIIAGFSYHLKDEFFSKVKKDASDNSLMENKENGNYRPHFYCLEDEKVKGLYWVVPISSKVEKYRLIQEKKINKFGKCNTIVIGLFAGKENAFLIQNMFPVTAKYFDHIHRVSNLPITIHSEVKESIETNVKEVLSLTRAGENVLFADIEHIERLMLEEISLSLSENQA